MWERYHNILPLDVERDSAMKYTVTNNKGEIVARYDHRSEVETFMNASVKDGPARYDAEKQPGMLTVFDEKNNEHFQIGGPGVKDWENDVPKE